MLKDFNAVKISVASPQDVMNWSHGEVARAETINYRTFKPEPGGLMAEEIFGPTKDFECYCGKYKKIRYKGIVCDRCGVEITHKRVRRERMGHIKLAAPVAHVWFSNGVPNKLSLILDIPQKKLETVIYYARYVVTNVIDEEREKALGSLDELKKSESDEVTTELEEKIKEINAQFEEEAEDVRKSSKEKAKLDLQLERIRNNEKTQIARLKSAYKQKQDNIEKKFVDLKALIQSVTIGSTLSEEEYQLLESYGFYFFEAGMGAEAIKELLDKLNVDEEITLLEEELKTSKSQLKKSRIVQRLRIMKGLQKSGVHPSWVVLEVLPVIPPDLRPIVQLPGGRFATYDLNDLYRRVINRNNRLKRLIALGAPEIILRNEKRMLQEAVDSLLDNNHKPGAPSLNTRGLPFKSLSDMLRGKQGRFRQNLLGKRVDYSGNAVIVPGPELQFDQCGLPKVIALELFRPFIIRELIARGLAANPAKAKLIFESGIDEVWDILEDVSKGRPVLLNRAPTLQKQSIIAFYPVLIEGNAIRLHPMTCAGFNADFDGDQMAVHLPLSEKAVEEVKDRMFAKNNLLSLKDGSPLYNVSKDMAFGIYFLTLMRGTEADAKNTYANIDELISAYYLGKVHFDEPVKLLLDGKVIVTTAGRARLNKSLPEGHEFINSALGLKDISALSASIFNTYGNEIALETLDAIKSLGFIYAGRLGFSVSMEEFRFGGDEILEKRLDEFVKTEDQLGDDYAQGFITENELKWSRRSEWQKEVEKIQDEIWELAQKKSPNLVDLSNSKAIPVAPWVKKISGVQGFVTDPSGNIVDLPLKNNFEKGLTNFEYFVAARGARKGFADVALRTADSGYLTRRLHDVAQDIVTNVEDCGTTEGVVIERADKRLQSFVNRLKGRYLAQDLANPKIGEVILSAGEAITLDLAKHIDAIEEITEVKVRSATTCRVAHGICQKCYGYDLGTGQPVEFGVAVGTIASQSLGEPATQLTLKSKSDARAGSADITQGFPRVEELLEARTPKALALLSDIPGQVKIIDDKKKVIIRVTGEKKVVKKYQVDKEESIAVKDGKKVKVGDTLAIIKKKELQSEIDGIASVEGKVITVRGTKEVEVEKETESLINLVVKDGQIVEQGDQLTFGSIDPKELAKLKSIEEAQKYIIRGVQEVIGISGIEVDDKHLEIIVRQMARYAMVVDSGDSKEYLLGDYVDVLDLEAENERLQSEGLKPIKSVRVLMGITNSALRTESFLSAASFEQQVRVLTDAALIGKVDHLRGLKENVIIGRPVPLGDELKKQLGLIVEEEVVEPSADTVGTENEVESTTDEFGFAKTSEAVEDAASGNVGEQADADENPADIE
ncbi:DNA-directed RNA polymerase subunit beta' [Candidatus Dojkabacteria bacterium]|nr:DNA-directed RNA polymerase subunit beta' [Candidatus Dojkabacteria bacterium]